MVVTDKFIDKSGIIVYTIYDKKLTEENNERSFNLRVISRWLGFNY